jgi:hypothetical protein
VSSYYLLVFSKQFRNDDTFAEGNYYVIKLLRDKVGTGTHLLKVNTFA